MGVYLKVLLKAVVVSDGVCWQCVERCLEELINFFDVQGSVALVDLPGYGWAKVPKSVQASWGRTIQGYLEDRLQLKLAILLVDIRRKPGVEELNLLDWFTMQDRHCLIVATKADKVPKSQRAKAIKALSVAFGVATRDIVPFSTLTKEGRDTIWSTIFALTQAAAKNSAQP